MTRASLIPVFAVVAGGAIHAGRIESVSLDGLVLRAGQIMMPVARRDVERGRGAPPTRVVYIRR